MMLNLVTKLIVLTLLLYTLAGVAGQSPCPQYFRYIRDDATFEIMGQIEIPSPPKNVALHLKISLSLAAVLPTKYVGHLELAQSREESVRVVQQGRPLLYRIYFPLRRPIPLLTGLWFNNQLYCSGPRVTGGIITSIYLEHTLYPPGVLPLSQNQGNSIVPESNINNFMSPSTLRPSAFYPDQPPLNIIPSNTIPQPLSTPSPLPPPPPPTTTTTTTTARNVLVTSEDTFKTECGRSNINSLNLLIARGSKTTQGQWPWLVAIFIVRIEFEFQCAGTLVTKKHILTAAHCMKLDGVNVPASVMLVSLGRYRLRDWRERGSVNREVEEYRFHPDYRNDNGDETTADADLAVMILRTPVEFSPLIKPVCLWSGPNELHSVVGTSGYVVGWGRDELGNAYLAEPRMTKVPIVSLEVCHWSNLGFVTFTSNRTFCAGSRDGSGPCNGDSGTGLILRDNTGHYQLRGIVSRSVLDKNTMTCDLKQFVVYVDVAKHLDWIHVQISA